MVAVSGFEPILNNYSNNNGNFYPGFVFIFYYDKISYFSFIYFVFAYHTCYGWWNAAGSCFWWQLFLGVVALRFFSHGFSFFHWDRIYLCVVGTQPVYLFPLSVFVFVAQEKHTE